MLSLEQVKHILTYYFLDMIPNYDKNTPVHVHRDCVYLNKTRGELCSDIYSNPKLVQVIRSIHDSVKIHQINSVPVNSLCCIDKKAIPISSAGIQLIIYTKKSVEHLCIQKKYQQLCYYYFKLRNFPQFVQFEIANWLNKQPWYLPRACNINTVLKRILESKLPNKIHTELEEIIVHLNQCWER